MASSSSSVIQDAKVLMVGAGGIGCELLKTLALSGFSDIHIIDMDTIEVSNLNRQFLFRQSHVGQSKAKVFNRVARDAVLKFRPHINITPYHSNVKDPDFNVDFFKQFNVVLNGLDNLDARRHVNRLCLAADVPLVESGTTGVLGQGRMECYECQPKQAPKTYPVCTITSTPSKVNNNFLSVGNANKEINGFNFSTGRVINKSVFDSEVTSMDHDHTGHLIFCGDAQGCIYSVNMNSHTGGLSRSHRYRSSSKHKSPVTTVQYRSFSLLARGPVLLTCTQDGNLSFFSVALEIKGYLTLRCSLKLTPRIHKIQASFCPLLSLEKGEFIVSGSEDSNVYFYDLTKPKHTCVNKLQGHRFPVMGIAWNHGENLLASSDFYGVVIVWKREKANQNKNT